MPATIWRRICWPTPDATCLQGGCGWCNLSPYRSLNDIMAYAKTAGDLHHRAKGHQNAVQALEWGIKNGFPRADVRRSRPRVKKQAAATEQ